MTFMRAIPLNKAMIKVSCLFLFLVVKWISLDRDLAILLNTFSRGFIVFQISGGRIRGNSRAKIQGLAKREVEGSKMENRLFIMSGAPR